MSAAETLVSVVLPFRNAERFLREAVASALAQTHRKLEIILIDDGSTDGSAAVAETFLADERVRLLRQEWAGAGAARNAGLAQARGGAVAFLDADDRWLPRKLELQLPLLAETALVYCGYRAIDAAGAPTGSEYRPRYSGAVLERLLVNNFIALSSALLRTESVAELGECFNPKLLRIEDWDFWLRLAERHRVAALPEALLEYRRHAAASSEDLDLAHAMQKKVLQLAEARLVADPAYSAAERGILLRCLGGGRVLAEAKFAAKLFRRGRYGAAAARCAATAGTLAARPRSLPAFLRAAADMA